MDALLGYLLHGAYSVLIKNATDKAVNRKVIDLFLAVKAKDFRLLDKVYRACYEEFKKPPRQRCRPQKIIKDIFGECLSEHKLAVEFVRRSIKSMNMYRKMLRHMTIVYNVWFGLRPVHCLETLFHHLPDDLRARDLRKAIIKS